MLALLHWLAARLPCRQIADAGGTLYLERYRVIGAMNGRHRWFPFTVYLHRFHRPDLDRALHNHPWPWAFSLVLAGGYDELRPGLADWWHSVRTLKAGSVNWLRGYTFHRVAELHGETWTLFVVGRKVQAWGYDVPGRGFVPWRQFESEKS
jgi:hypothetical protein